MTARERLYLQFVAEEVASALRHRLVNKIAAVGALTFHLRRQLPEGETPAAARAVLPMIDAELAQASQTLDLRFVGPQAPAAAPVALGRLAESVLASLVRVPGIQVVGPRGPAPSAVGDPQELDLALYCLVDNAVDAVAGGGTVAVRFAAAEARAGTPMIALEVADDGPGMSEADRRHAKDPFFTTKPARLGLGLNVAHRIAQRWGGAVELMDGRPGLIARLLLPVAVA
jgi:signal transduction histidine kinase